MASLEKNLERIQRDLIGGSLHLGILATIGTHGPVHGYAVIRILSDSIGGPEPFQSGTIYPILNDLEKDGLVRSKWAAGEAGPQRKEYELTPQGRQALRASAREWQRLRDSLNQLLTSHTEPSTARPSRVAHQETAKAK